MVAQPLQRRESSDGRGGVTSQVMTLSLALEDAFADGFAAGGSESVAGTGSADVLTFGSGTGAGGSLIVDSGDGDDSLVLGDGAGGVGSPSYDVRYDLLYVGTEDGGVYAVRAPFP